MMMSTTAAAPLPIVGFGHPLLDISCNVTQAVLDRYGVEKGSCNLAQESQLPIFEDLSQRREVEFVPGGACMNSIRVSRWLLGQNVCSFVGCLGDDEFGCILERALHLAGVRSIFQRNEDKPTGTCACLIVESERSLLANLGAAVELSMPHMSSPEVVEVLEAGQIFYLEGFFMNLVSSPHSSIAIGKHCALHNKYFTFNLSAPYLCEFFKDKLSEIMPYVDILFGSRIDYTAYAESHGWDTTDMTTVLHSTVEQPKKNVKRDRLVIMTDGSDATWVAERGQPVRKFKPGRVNPEDIVDTNGAGDAFVGGFLSQLAKQRDLETSIAVGHAAAGVIIQQNGCSTPEHMPPHLAEMV